MTIRTSSFSELTIDELYNILRLRAEVFIVEQNCPYQDLDGRDRNSFQIWAEEDGETLGCLRVFMYDDTYAQIGRVVTSQKIRGMRWGMEMIKIGIETIGKHYGNVPILIHSQAYATGFYEKFGFRITSEEFMEDGIPHFEMIRPADPVILDKKQQPDDPEIPAEN
ncbi:MAG: GNAT family N-acetyltransferase [Bacteroidales bacterium]|nr:GNAT family N-acetyltransferase [Bacteroidales bacterium]